MNERDKVLAAYHERLRKQDEEFEAQLAKEEKAKAKKKKAKAK